MAIFTSFHKDETINGTHDEDDTYIFSGEFGNDTINDTGGLEKLIFTDAVGLLDEFSFTRESDGTVRIVMDDNHSVTINPDSYEHGRYTILHGEEDDEEVLGILYVARTLGETIRAEDQNGDPIADDAIMFGSASNDELYGSEGEDTLYGGEGNDILIGGANSDTYVLSSGDNGAGDDEKDVIDDDGGLIVFQQGNDGDDYDGASYTRINSDDSDVVTLIIEKNGARLNVIEFVNGLGGYTFVTRTSTGDTTLDVNTFAVATPPDTSTSINGGDRTFDNIQTFYASTTTLSGSSGDDAYRIAGWGEWGSPVTDTHTIIDTSGQDAIYFVSYILGSTDRGIYSAESFSEFARDGQNLIISVTSTSGNPQSVTITDYFDRPDDFSIYYDVDPTASYVAEPSGAGYDWVEIEPTDIVEYTGTTPPDTSTSSNGGDRTFDNIQTFYASTTTLSGSSGDDAYRIAGWGEWGSPVTDTHTIIDTSGQDAIYFVSYILGSTDRGIYSAESFSEFARDGQNLIISVTSTSGNPQSVTITDYFDRPDDFSIYYDVDPTASYVAEPSGAGYDWVEINLQGREFLPFLATTEAESFVGSEDAGWVSYENTDSNGVTVYLDANDGSNAGSFASGDTFAGIANLIGSDYSDIFYGDSNDNNLYGGAGDDTLGGGAGDDDYSFEYQHSGSDTITDNEGDNELYFKSDAQGNYAADSITFAKSTDGDDLIISNTAASQQVTIVNYYNLPEDASFSIYYNTEADGTFTQIASDAIPV